MAVVGAVARRFDLARRRRPSRSSSPRRTRASPAVAKPSALSPPSTTAVRRPDPRSGWSCTCRRSSMCSPHTSSPPRTRAGAQGMPQGLLSEDCRRCSSRRRASCSARSTSLLQRPRREVALARRERGGVDVHAPFCHGLLDADAALVPELHEGAAVELVLERGLVRRRAARLELVGLARRTRRRTRRPRSRAPTSCPWAARWSRWSRWSRSFRRHCRGARSWGSRIGRRRSGHRCMRPR